MNTNLECALALLFAMLISLMQTVDTFLVLNVEARLLCEILDFPLNYLLLDRLLSLKIAFHYVHVALVGHFDRVLVLHSFIKESN